MTRPDEVEKEMAERSERKDFNRSIIRSLRTGGAGMQINSKVVMSDYSRGPRIGLGPAQPRPPIGYRLWLWEWVPQWWGAPDVLSEMFSASLALPASVFCVTHVPFCPFSGELHFS